MSALYGINANNDATAARQGAPGAGSTGNNVPAADKHTDDEAINEKPSSSPADTLGKDEEDEDSSYSGTGCKSKRPLPTVIFLANLFL